MSKGMEVIKVKYNPKYLLRMFKDFSTAELEEIVKGYSNTEGLSADEKMFRNMVSEELARREKKEYKVCVRVYPWNNWENNWFNNYTVTAIDSQDAYKSAQELVKRLNQEERGDLAYTLDGISEI